jgi:hypothetical protein
MGICAIIRELPAGSGTQPVTTGNFLPCEVINVSRFAAPESSVRVIAGVCLVAIACMGSDKPRVEVVENGVYVQKSVRTYQISGARDGAITRAVAVLTLADGDRIRIELEVSYNPTPELASGHWQREGKTSEAGDVRAEALKFLGGQGSAPSVGGRFLLVAYENPRMRVVLPTQPLERAR